MKDYRICNYNEERIDFTATVKVPVGFIMASLKDYAIDLILDRSNLHVTKVREITPSSRTERTHEFNLKGSIGYNVVVREFRPAKLLQGERVTAFTTHDTLVVDMDWRCKYHDVLLPEHRANLFDVGVIKHREFVVDEMGQRIPFYRTCPYPFIEALSYASGTQVIYIPYTLIIRTFNTYESIGNI